MLTRPCYGPAVSTTAPARRAAPLSPPERRAAIIAATIPLLREFGVGLTTRRISEAAQVAEGTIFSVFPDKATLIGAAVEAALDPRATVAKLEAIKPDVSLEEQLGLAVGALQGHFADIWRLLAAVGPEGAPRKIPERAQAFANFGPALAELLERAGGQLRVSGSDAARILLALAIGGSHPAVVQEPMAAGEVVTLFLDGVRRRR